MPRFFTDALSPTEFPRWADTLGFLDDSWHNDAAARATYILPMMPGDDRTDRYKLTLWVSPNMRDNRETPEYPQFLLLFDRHDEDDPSANGDTLFRLYSGESSEDCRLMAVLFTVIWERRT